MFGKKKDKKQDKAHEHDTPIRQGDKFICPHCGAEIPQQQACPTCGAEVDWKKI